MGLLGPGGFNSLRDSGTLPPRAAVPIPTPISAWSTYVPMVPHNVWYSKNLEKLALLMGHTWFLMVLICVSLITNSIEQLSRRVIGPLHFLFGELPARVLCPFDSFV